MSPKYKLSYFNATGLGEPIRYMLAYAKIDFEDSRFEFNEWEKIKPDTPFGKAPILEIDGKKLHQSAAICRYIAKLAGIAGKTDLDALNADIFVDTLTDFRMNVSAYFRETNEEAKAAKLKEVKEEHLPYYFERFEKMVSENGGYIVNGQLTWADVFFAAIGDLLLNLLKEPVLDKYPKMKALKEKVENLPGIKEYREKRPTTMI